MELSVIQFSASSLVVGLPPPTMGEGWGGGAALDNQYAWPLPPIPAFPRNGGKEPNSSDKSGEKRKLNDPAVTLLTLAFHAERAHSFWLAMRAPSARAPSFAQAIAGSTVGAPAKVAKPQSTPAMTFSRPTMSA